jgi:hypothetical protein
MLGRVASGAEGRQAVKALSGQQTRRIVDRLQTLISYNRKIVPGSILNVVEKVNFDPSGR